jgi:hypothetical protein
VRAGMISVLPYHGKSTCLVQMQRSFLFQSGFAASRRHLCNWLMWTKIQSLQPLEETNDTEVRSTCTVNRVPNAPNGHPYEPLTAECAPG